jgi:hypothetical protein
MKKYILPSIAFVSWLGATSCGRLGTGDDRISGDGDVAIGDGDIAGDGDSSGDGDRAGDGDSQGDGDVGTGGSGGSIGGDGDVAFGGMGGNIGGDGDVAQPGFPTCTITNFDDEARIPFFGGRDDAGKPTGIDFAAAATDLEDGPLGGESVKWYRVGEEGNELLGTGTSIKINKLPPGENVILCEAVDSEQNSGLDKISVTSISPVLYINHPGDADGPRPAGKPIEFLAVGYDYEDGTLNPSNFQWSSSIDGSLGSGDGPRTLTVGEHKISVKGIDEDENLGVAFVIVTIAPPVIIDPLPPVGAN